MLQVVDADRGSLAETHRAKVARYLDPQLVRGFDGGSQLGAGDVHVRFEGGHSLIGPILDGFARVFGALQGMHL